MPDRPRAGTREPGGAASTFPIYPRAPAPKTFASFDGRTIAYREIGVGRPTVLIHGILSDSAWAWFGPGHAAAVAALGRRVVVPDLRGHGRSDAPRESTAYADDALSRDIEALLEVLQLGEVDLVGYSLGARTAIRCLARGMLPGRVVLGGIGDTLATSDGSAAARRFDRLGRTDGPIEDPADAATSAWLAYAGFDPMAMRALTVGLVATSHAELAAIDVPALVVIGSDDRTVGSAQRLAALLGRASARTIPGDHVHAGLGPAFAAAIRDFLGAA